MNALHKFTFDIDIDIGSSCLLSWAHGAVLFVRLYQPNSFNYVVVISHPSVL